MGSCADHLCILMVDHLKCDDIRYLLVFVTGGNTRGLPCKGKIQSLSNLIRFKDLKKLCSYIIFKFSTKFEIERFVIPIRDLIFAYPRFST